MKTLNRIAIVALSTLTGGTCGVASTYDRAFRDADRRAAGERELARILAETPADRRDAELVAALIGGPR